MADDGEVRIERVANAQYFIGDLFRRTFNGTPPSHPVNYVAFLSLGRGTFRAVGYYHVDYRGEYSLVGGLCVEPEVRGRGVGEMLERIAFENLEGAKGFFAYVGDPKRALRVGFEQTQHPRLVVRWLATVSPADEKRIIDEVAALGPF